MRKVGAVNVTCNNDDAIVVFSPEDLLDTWSWLFWRVMPADASWALPDLEKQLFKEYPRLTEVDADERVLMFSYFEDLMRNLQQKGAVERVGVPDPEGVDQSACRWRRQGTWWIEKDEAKKPVVHETSVRLEALPGDPAVDVGRGDGRRRIRHQVACAVCARRGMNRTYEYFWRQPPGSGRRSLIRDTTVPHCSRARVDGDAPVESAEDHLQSGAVSCRDKFRDLFDLVRYANRWKFGESGGIPLKAIEDTCVKEPGTGRLWMLNKSLFRYKEDASRNCEAADPDQTVPVCNDCRGVLSSNSAAKPPKYALCNDLWLGPLPTELRDLSEGAWMLLALARPFIKRMNCFGESKSGNPDEAIKGFIGNTGVFP